MEHIDFLIVGGGLAGAKCAQKIREEGGRGRVCIVAAESHLPYNRPPLSKGLPLGYTKPDRIYVHSEDYYQTKGIELIRGVTIVSIDPEAGTAYADNGRRFAFGKMLAATGTTPRRLKLPGGDLENIFYLRTVEDSLAIIGAMKLARKAVIIGAGFIGMELASAFVQNGLDTTMLVRENALFSKLGSEPLSRFFEAYYKGQGVSVIFGDSAAKFEGQGKVNRVVTEAGRQLDADLVAVGIGVMPNTGWLEGSGVALDNGIVVDEYLQSNKIGVFAAGDVANFYDPIFKKRRRIEHWDNASKQGELAALNMLGKRTSYNTVAYFFSDLFDLSWEWLGDNADTDRAVIRGSLEDRSAIIFYLKENRLKAAFLLMQGPKERLWVERAIIENIDLSAALSTLQDTDWLLERIVGE